eukprot:scaffold395_cov243-Pinguiococcus_pyrenoidosus.AAC.12
MKWGKTLIAPFRSTGGLRIARRRAAKPCGASFSPSPPTIPTLDTASRSISSRAPSCSSPRRKRPSGS